MHFLRSPSKSCDFNTKSLIATAPSPPSHPPTSVTAIHVLCLVAIYRLTHSASELSGFTCTSSLTMNEKFSIPHEAASCGIENFEFIVSERVQVNADNSLATSALTFLLFKLNTLHKKTLH